MATRRGFFGFLAASPLVAKETAEKAIAELAQINVSGAGISSSGVPASIDDSRLVDAGSWVRQFGLPEFAERNIRDNARNVYALDPDIAIKRSWSLSVKIQEQRQRNFAREIERVKNGGQYELSKKAFRAISGFEWPWWH